MEILKKNKGVVIFGGVLVLVVMWAVSSYNSFIKIDEAVNNAFAKVETQYQRRFDLIPNLEAVVSGSADFQQETFVKVAQARSAWANATNVNSKVSAANNLESTLSKLVFTAESNPNLDVQAFLNLQTDLAGTENRINFARDGFNDAATEYNVVIRVFPRNLIANLFGFDSKKELFNSNQGAENAPAVDFSK
jgi:LemA protein